MNINSIFCKFLGHKKPPPLLEKIAAILQMQRGFYKAPCARCGKVKEFYFIGGTYDDPKKPITERQ